MLRTVLRIGGLIATAAGGHTSIAGARSLPGRPRADAVLDSELRFYGAFYVAYGLAMLRVAPRADREPAAVRALAAALLGAGISRALSWAHAGVPHPVQRALLAVELAAPVAVVALQRRISLG